MNSAERDQESMNMGRDVKSMELAKAKADFAFEVTKAEPTLTMMAVGKKVIEKFGQSLAPYRLREAFLEGGGTIQPRKKRAASPSPRSGAVGASLAPFERDTQRKRDPGRRKADKAATRIARTLNALEKHVVVLKADNTEVHEFGSAEQAKRFVAAKVSDGRCCGRDWFLHTPAARNQHWHLIRHRIAP
jgi:hypothetical protein